MLKIKNWKKFQHFKDRRPPWIKLYRDLLDDHEWFALPPDSFKFLAALWLMASESSDGCLPDIKAISFRYRVDVNEVNRLLSTLSHWVEGVDIKAISRRYQPDTPETERETEERERKRERKTVAPVGAPASEIALSNGSVGKTKPVHVDFVDRFKDSYQSMTGQPFQQKREHFVIASKLIKEHGVEIVIQKAKILGALCRDRSVWFTKSGWADFSIEKLSSMWNSIITDAVEENIQVKENRLREELAEKRRIENERIESVMGRK